MTSPVRRDVVMFVYNDASSDSRVWRTSGTLREAGYRVSVVALGRPGHEPYEQRREGLLMRVPKPPGGILPGDPSNLRDPRPRGFADRSQWLLRYSFGHALWSRQATKAALGLTAGESETIWHGHDLTGLVPALQARRARPGPVVYDSHELFLGAGSAARLPRALHRGLELYEGRLVRRADAVVTVSDLIASQLAGSYRIPRPTVIMNCPPLGEEHSRAASPLRTTLGLGRRPVLLHHGKIISGRGVHETIRALDLLPEDVAFVVLGDGELVPALERLSGARYHGRLFLHPPVGIDDVPQWVAGADLGVIALQPTTRNHLSTIPNKLFECLASGVPVVASDFPELRRIVLGERVGATCDPTAPSSIAAAVSALLGRPQGELGAMRRRARAAAAARYSWERQSERLLDLYANGLGLRGRPGARAT